ncbi:RNA-guided endonuclease TnpB family protein, partial [Hassallia sp. VBCCA 56010]
KKLKESGIIHLHKTSILIHSKHAQNYDCVRIIPSSGCYVIEVVYTRKDVKLSESGLKAAIDLGVNNLGT